MFKGGGERRSGRQAEAHAASDKENVDANRLHDPSAEDPAGVAKEAKAPPVEDGHNGGSAAATVVADVPVVKAFVQAAVSSKVRCR